MDELFKTAYRKFKEEPTDEVWTKINTALEKKDAESYKKRSATRKRVLPLLLLLLGGLILYETMIIQESSAISKKNSVVATNIKSERKKEANSELHDKMDIGNRRPVYVESVLETSNRMLIKNQLAQNIDLRMSDQNFLTHATPICFMERIKTSNPGPMLINEALAPSRLFIDNSISKIQAAHKNSRIAWDYTPFVSYEWAQYRIDSDLPAVNSIKRGNEHEPSFSTGILLTAQFTGRWMLQSGFVYSNTTIDMAPQKIYAVHSPAGDYAYKYITSAGYGYIRPSFGATPVLGDSLSTAQAKHTLRYITVPIEVRYKIAKGRISIVPGTGIAANFLTATKVETEIKNATDKETVTITSLTGIRHLNWSLTADAEMQYQLDKKTSLNLRPAFRYAISSITKNDDFQTFPYAFGIGLGMTFKF